MAEYIEREAVCYQLEKQESIDGQPRAIRRARRIVADFPAADVVPVVRCKDCKHLCVRSGALGVYKCAIHGDYPSDEYYCADGKRMDGDGE